MPTTPSTTAYITPGEHTDDDTAGEAFATGNLTEAVTKAQRVKTKVAEVMTALGMQLPEALK